MKLLQHPESGISLFMPVYNSAGIIMDSLRKTYEALSLSKNDFEIIIVDDNSTDMTCRIGKTINQGQWDAARQIRYVSYDRGPSRRENLARSFPMARYEVMGFIDADLSCDISYFLKAVHLLEEHTADIVIGSRYAPGARAKRRLFRLMISMVYNHALGILLDSTFKDHQCGLKVFRKSRAMPIVEKMGYDENYARGWSWDAEFLIRSQKAGLKIVEMPVHWIYAESSSFNFFREMKCVPEMVKLRKSLNG
jgi:hypothetical protein